VDLIVTAVPPLMQAMGGGAPAILLGAYLGTQMIDTVGDLLDTRKRRGAGR